MQKVLLVAGGRAPSPAWFLAAAAQYPVWSVDKGINTCHKCGVEPERLVGDADSADTESWHWGKKVCSVVDKFPAEKDHTDLQLAFKLLGEAYSPAAAVITGCWGGRFDHTWSNVRTMLWAKEWGVRGIAMADDAETMIIVEGPDTVEFELSGIPQNVSLLPLSQYCTGVSLQGVRWPLSDITLYANRPYAVSNRLLGENGKLSVKVQCGCLGVYLQW